MKLGKELENTKGEWMKKVSLKIIDDTSKRLVKNLIKGFRD
ncbi:hypothetical protein QNH39_01090 [Neobacillus novalis]|uniref:Uncharacterized protein n=1 Tax=Neobacillus novalis TaxID=220687 RepID=A0AA95MU76_9BACI|nr:hypothetical protein [Neobacillus novalis]WHY86523.1 hypothetical protein QNH39_01090 [Neobacillus novalis]